MQIPVKFATVKWEKEVNMKTKRKTVKALCVRTAMIGGGTSYDVYFRCKDKPSRPLHGLQYATEVYPCGWQSGGGFYRVDDAIDRRERWSMEQGWDKWESHKKLEKVANRLAVRIAKRAFPELNGAKKLPPLWAGWTLPSEEKWVEVNMQLPE